MHELFDYEIEELIGERDSADAQSAFDSGERISQFFEDTDIEIALRSGGRHSLTKQDWQDFLGEEVGMPRTAPFPPAADDLQKSHIKLAKNYFLDRMRQWIAAGESVWSFINGSHPSIRKELEQLAREAGLLVLDRA